MVEQRPLRVKVAGSNPVRRPHVTSARLGGLVTGIFLEVAIRKTTRNQNILGGVKGSHCPGRWLEQNGLEGLTGIKRDIAICGSRRRQPIAATGRVSRKSGSLLTTFILSLLSKLWLAQKMLSRVLAGLVEKANDKDGRVLVGGYAVGSTAPVGSAAPNSAAPDSAALDMWDPAALAARNPTNDPQHAYGFVWANRPVPMEQSRRKGGFLDDQNAALRNQPTLGHVPRYAPVDGAPPLHTLEPTPGYVRVPWPW